MTREEFDKLRKRMTRREFDELMKRVSGLENISADEAFKILEEDARSRDAEDEWYVGTITDEDYGYEW